MVYYANCCYNYQCCYPGYNNYCQPNYCCPPKCCKPNKSTNVAVQNNSDLTITALNAVVTTNKCGSISTTTTSFSPLPLAASSSSVATANVCCKNFELQITSAGASSPGIIMVHDTAFIQPFTVGADTYTVTGNYCNCAWAITITGTGS